MCIERPVAAGESVVLVDADSAELLGVPSVECVAVARGHRQVSDVRQIDSLRICLRKHGHLKLVAEVGVEREAVEVAFDDEVLVRHRVAGGLEERREGLLVALADVDPLQRRRACECVGVDVLEDIAGRNHDRLQRRAAVEGVLADVGDGGRQRHAGDLVAVLERIPADAGNRFATGPEAAAVRNIYTPLRIGGNGMHSVAGERRGVPDGEPTSLLRQRRTHIAPFNAVDRIRPLRRIRLRVDGVVQVGRKALGIRHIQGEEGATPHG